MYACLCALFVCAYWLCFCLSVFQFKFGVVCACVRCLAVFVLVCGSARL